MSAKARSRWGWGFEGEMPAGETLREQKAFMEEELGFPELPVLEPVPVEEATVPEPTVGVPDRLADFCTADRGPRMRHTYGMAEPENIRAFHGDFSPAPDLVARPRTEEEVADVLAWAGEANVAVTPVTGGTGVVGGSGPPEGDLRAAYDGTLALNLRELDQVALASTRASGPSHDHSSPSSTAGPSGPTTSLSPNSISRSPAVAAVIAAFQ